MPTPVETWFGAAFERLHPALQRLHREGGVLSGPVDIVFGTGLAGVVGRRLARRLGVPADGAGGHQLQVSIHGGEDGLHWNRSFDGRTEFKSTFVPVGRHPTGHWVESSGALQLRLGVSIVDGAWHWVHAGSRLFGVPLPGGLMPRTVAGKAFRDERYHFHVEVVMPGLGRVLSYSGGLTGQPTAQPSTAQPSTAQPSTPHPPAP